MAVESDIFAALMARVASLALTPAMPVAYPNVTYTPPAAQRYLEVKFVPNDNDRFGMSTTHRIFGLLQFNVHGKKGTGEAAARTDAAAVAGHFPCDLELESGATRLRITSRPAVRDMIVEDASVFIPILVSWETFV